jgi:hypothetical protein
MNKFIYLYYILLPNLIMANPLAPFEQKVTSIIPSTVKLAVAIGVLSGIASLIYAKIFDTHTGLSKLKVILFCVVAAVGLKTFIYAIAGWMGYN